ncbi:MAG: hypothetical protein A2X36_01680 [Elusimicrobia bacterium GWA2_69_24]|nr:MAG: hypothetical protein A2X36_01680 [Elusimicrobia bacterium GWA2_69_24]
MFWVRLLISLVEFSLSIVLSVLVVYSSYKGFVRLNTAFDAEVEIRKGNVAVAVLMASLMYGAALIMRESIYPVTSIVTVGFMGGGGHGFPALAAYAFGHLILGFILSVGCVQIALRFFNILSGSIDEEEEIGRANVAVAVLMGAVILVVSLFMQQGVSSLTKSLIPQPKLGTLRMME